MVSTRRPYTLKQTCSFFYIKMSCALWWTQWKFLAVSQIMWLDYVVTLCGFMKIECKTKMLIFLKLLGLQFSLSFSWRKSPSYRNQYIDFLWKSMDWSLYDRDLRHERFNHFRVHVTIYFEVFQLSAPFAVKYWKALR